MRVGTHKSDILVGYIDEDRFVFGLEGNDWIGRIDHVAPSDDWLYGNEGDDYLYSFTGNDRLFGNTGSDLAVIYHHDGITRFDGGKGFDQARLIGFSDEATITEYNHRTVITDGDCKVVLRNVEEWS